MDLTSLILLAGIFFGFVVTDAALFADPVQVQIAVPSKLSDAGFSETAAEQIFAAQVAEMGRAQSIVRTPSVQISTRPSILAAMAKPLQLDNVVVAIQAQAGVDVVTVHSVIMPANTGNALDMVMVISMPHEVPVQIRLSQADGDATALVQRSAESAMEFVSPYRLALTHFARGLKGDAKQLARAKEISTRAVARSFVPERATELVMLHDLLAMLALLDNDDATVKAQFAAADLIPGAEPVAHGVIELNRSFLALSAGKPKEAQQLFDTGKLLAPVVHVRSWRARIDELGGMVAMGNGDLAQAEKLLREALAELPEDEGAHYYLALVLEAKGDTAGAAAERTAAANSRRFDIDIPAQAQSLFWVDPVHGGLKRRQ